MKLLLPSLLFLIPILGLCQHGIKLVPLPVEVAFARQPNINGITGKQKDGRIIGFWAFNPALGYEYQFNKFRVGAGVSLTLGYLETVHQTRIDDLRIALGLNEEANPDENQAYLNTVFHRLGYLGYYVSGAYELFQIPNQDIQFNIQAVFRHRFLIRNRYELDYYRDVSTIGSILPQLETIQELKITDELAEKFEENTNEQLVNVEIGPSMQIGKNHNKFELGLRFSYYLTQFDSQLTESTLGLVFHLGYKYQF